MPTLEYNNFKYIITNPLDFNNGMRIEYNNEIPTSLYKYYSPSKYNIESIKKGELYFSHPYKFNDITDTNPLSLDFTGMTFKNYCRFFAESNLKERELNEMYLKDRMLGFSGYRIQLYSLWTQKIGICCFTTNEMHDLMWGHYATDSGFKIKFNTEDLLNSLNSYNKVPSKLFPINYVDRKLMVNVPKYGIGLPLLLDFSTKVKSWIYENEWRIVMSKKDMDVPNSIKTPDLPNHSGKDTRLFKFDSQSISEIVLGMDFFNGHNLVSKKILNPLERLITTNDESLSSFLSYIIDRIPNQIYQAGIYNDNIPKYEGAYPLGRSIEKVELAQFSSNQFIIKRTNPDSFKKF